MDRTLKGTIVGEYRISSFLGKGPGGEVYKARDLTLGKLAAIKLFLKDDVAPDIVIDILKMAKLASEIHHKNTVEVYEVGEADRFWYILMEYVDGKDCTRLLKRCPRMSVPDAVRIIRNAAEGVKAFHDHGVTHCNIKPQNILASLEGTIKIADLGLPSPGSFDHFSAKIRGTCAYMAPEQLKNTQINSTLIDIYSLGSVFYYLITHRRVYEEPTEQAMWSALEEGRKFLLPHEIIMDIPRPVSDVIGKMLAKDPKDRYQSITELMVGLKKLGKYKKDLVPSVWDNPIFFAQSIQQSQLISKSVRVPVVRRGTPLKIWAIAALCLLVGIFAALSPRLLKSSPGKDFEMIAIDLINESREIKTRFRVDEPVMLLLTLKWLNPKISHVNVKISGRDLQSYEKLLERKERGEIYEEKIPMTFARRAIADYQAQLTLTSSNHKVQKSLAFSLISPDVFIQLLSSHLENEAGQMKNTFEAGENVYLVVKWRLSEFVGPQLCQIILDASFAKEQIAIGNATPGELQIKRVLLPKIRAPLQNHNLNFALSCGKIQIARELSLMIIPRQPAFKMVSLKMVDSSGTKRESFYYGEEIYLRVVWNILKLSGESIKIEITGEDIDLHSQKFSSRSLGELSTQLPIKIGKYKDGKYNVKLSAVLGEQQIDEVGSWEMVKPPPQFEIISVAFLNAQNTSKEIFDLDEPIWVKIRWKVSRVYGRAQCRLFVSGNPAIRNVEEALKDIEQSERYEHQTRIWFVSPRPGSCVIQVKLSVDNIEREMKAGLQIQEIRIANMRISPFRQEFSPGEKLQFKLKCYDKKNREIDGDVTWEATGGSISQDGLYTAGNRAGEYTIKVRESKSGVEARAEVIISYALTRIEISPGVIDIKPGEKIGINAQGYDRSGTEISFQPRWTVSGGTFSQQENPRKISYVAGNQGGQWKVEVKDDETGIFARVSVNIQSVSLGWFNEEMPPGIRRAETKNEYIWHKDNSVMVYVPPDASLPQGFYIDKYELTIGQFANFVKVTNYKTRAELDGFSMIQDGTRWKRAAVSWRSLIGEFAANYPVVYVTLQDVNNYAQWAKKRLPTQVEWMKSAGDAKYPWGDDEPGTNRCNYAPTWNTRTEDGYAYLAPVGSYPRGASSHGCMDMAGNVCEWTASGTVHGGSWCYDARGCTTMVSLTFHSLCLRNGCNAIGARLAVSQK